MTKADLIKFENRLPQKHHQIFTTIDAQVQASKKNKQIFQLATSLYNRQVASGSGDTSNTNPITIKVSSVSLLVTIWNRYWLK